MEDEDNEIWSAEDVVEKLHGIFLILPADWRPGQPFPYPGALVEAEYKTLLFILREALL